MGPDAKALRCRHRQGRLCCLPLWHREGPPPLVRQAQAQCLPRALQPHHTPRLHLHCFTAAARARLLRPSQPPLHRHRRHHQLLSREVRAAQLPRWRLWLPLQAEELAQLLLLLPAPAQFGRLFPLLILRLLLLLLVALLCLGHTRGRCRRQLGLRQRQRRHVRSRILSRCPRPSPPPCPRPSDPSGLRVLGLQALVLVRVSMVRVLALRRLLMLRQAQDRGAAAAEAS